MRDKSEGKGDRTQLGHQPLGSSICQWSGTCCSLCRWCTGIPLMKLMMYKLPLHKVDTAMHQFDLAQGNFDVIALI